MAPWLRAEVEAVGVVGVAELELGDLVPQLGQGGQVGLGLGRAQGPQPEVGDLVQLLGDGGDRGRDRVAVRCRRMPLSYREFWHRPPTVPDRECGISGQLWRSISKVSGALNGVVSTLARWRSLLDHRRAGAPPQPAPGLSRDAGLSDRVVLPGRLDHLLEDDAVDRRTLTAYVAVTQPHQPVEPYLAGSPATGPSRRSRHPSSTGRTGSPGAGRGRGPCWSGAASAAHAAVRAITSTGRSLPRLESSSNGTHAQTTSPGSARPFARGAYLTSPPPVSLSRGSRGSGQTSRIRGSRTRVS